MASQLGGKSTPESSNSTPHDEKKTYGAVIFFKNRSRRKYDELKNRTGPTISKFLYSKYILYTTYGVKEETND